MAGTLTKPHLWSTLALLCSTFALIVPEPWQKYVVGGATFGSGMVNLCLQWAGLPAERPAK